MSAARDFLASLTEERLLENDSFPLNDQDKSVRHKTCFFPAMIASMLQPGTLPGQADMLCKFLLEQAGESWTWNYWPRRSRLNKLKPYPDDLDDTACSLSALHAHLPDGLDKSVVAQAVQTLCLQETEEGGPYRTWIVPTSFPDIWQDVDLAVNMNVAYFLSRLDVELPKLTDLAEAAISANAYRSRYYPSEYPVIYFLCRWYRGDNAAELRRHILDRGKGGIWDNYIHTALMVSSLIRLGASARQFVRSMKYLQSAKDFPSLAFCLDPQENDTPWAAGSSALTAAAILEAEGLYALHDKPIRINDRILPEQKAYVQVESYISQLPSPLRESTQKALKRIRQIDASQPLSQLPAMFNRSLLPDYRAPDKLIDQLSAAMIYGWAAYTLYDDVWDEEDAAIFGLAPANCCLRMLVQTFTGCMDQNPAFIRLMHETLDSMENDFLWEYTNCRYPQAAYQPAEYAGEISLSTRSMGHALAPLAILYSSQASKASLKETRRLFQNYLAARQLLDDIHDMRKDLEKGRVNYVACQLMRKYPKTTPEELEYILWNEEVAPLLDQATNLIKEAEEAYHDSHLFADTKFIEAILNPLRAAIRKAIKERDVALEIIKCLK